MDNNNELPNDEPLVDNDNELPNDEPLVDNNNELPNDEPLVDNNNELPNDEPLVDNELSNDDEPLVDNESQNDELLVDNNKLSKNDEPLIDNNNVSPKNDTNELYNYEPLDDNDIVSPKNDNNELPKDEPLVDNKLPKDEPQIVYNSSVIEMVNETLMVSNDNTRLYDINKVETSCEPNMCMYNSYPIKVNNKPQVDNLIPKVDEYLNDKPQKTKPTCDSLKTKFLKKLKKIFHIK